MNQLRLGLANNNIEGKYLNNVGGKQTSKNSKHTKERICHSSQMSFDKTKSKAIH